MEKKKKKRGSPSELRINTRGSNKKIRLELEEFVSSTSDDDDDDDDDESDVEQTGPNNHASSADMYSKAQKGTSFSSAIKLEKFNSETTNTNLQPCKHPNKFSSRNIQMAAVVDNKSSYIDKVDSKLDKAVVDFNGYKVKEEIVPLLKAIFSKYGDIAKESSYSTESRSCFLELVCSLYKRLEASKLEKLTPMELQSMFGQVGDLDLVDVEVGWLLTRLDQILKARQICGEVSTLEDAEARIILLVDEKKKAVETYEKQLESNMERINILQRGLRRERDELDVALALVDQIKLFYENSLVHGLI